MIGVYRITNSANGRQYIGSSQNVKGRWKIHNRDLNAGRHANRGLQHAWNKYGAGAFRFEVVCEVESLDRLIEQENIAIESARANGIKLYNTRIAAENNRGLKLGPMPNSVKAKISKSRIGIVPYNKGISWTDERRGSLTEDGRKRQGTPRREKTACPHGHPYTEENTYYAKNGQRQCRECGRLRMKRTRDRVARGVEGTNQK